MVSVQARDRHAMRVVAGIPQKMCKLFRDLFAQGMFEQMRLFVHLRFRHFQYGMEEHLNDAVLVCDELCGLASARGEPAAGLASIRVLPLRSSNLDTRDLRNERNCVKINILSSD